MNGKDSQSQGDAEKVDEKVSVEATESVVEKHLLQTFAIEKERCQE